MKTYTIANSVSEQIEFRVNVKDAYALVHSSKTSQNGHYRTVYKTIIMNQREVLNLYQAIQDELLNKKKE